MEDFFKRYKKNKNLNHLSIFGLAFMLALGVQFTFFSGERGQNLTADILGTTQTEQIDAKADIYAELKDDILIVKNSQAINDLEDISFTIAYNPELGDLSTSELGGLEVEVQAHENEPGLIFIQLMLLETQNLPENSTIARLPYEVSRDERQFFNIIQASFTDSDGEIYFLTSSGAGL